MKKALLKDSFKQIAKTNKRFISILLMAFMGVGFFAGVRATSPDMKNTIDNYYDKTKMYDISLVSTLGLTKDDVEAVSKIKGIDKVFGIYSEDVFLKFEEEESIAKYIVYKKEINDLNIVEGNSPKNADECVIDYNMSLGKNVKIGDYIDIREDLEEDEDPTFKNTKLEVVGIVKSPVYISRKRGNTSLGSGTIDYFIYGNENNIDSSIYTEIDISVLGAKELNTVDKEYDELVENVKNNIEKIKSEREKSRYDELISEANEKLNDAQKEFDEQKADAEKKIADAEKEIKDNEKKLKDAEKELQEGRDTATVEFANADAQISAAETKLAEGQEAIDAGRKVFEQKKKEADQGIKQLNTGIETINGMLKDLEENKTMVEGVLSGLAQIDSTITEMNDMIAGYQNDLANAATEEEKAMLNQSILYINSKIYELNLQKQELLAYGVTEEQLAQINAGIEECKYQKEELNKQLQYANSELAKGEAELVNGQNELAKGNEELAKSKVELNNKKEETSQKFKDAEKEITDGKKKLNDGKKELEEKKEEFYTEIADAESKLIDAREKVNDIENAKWYIFDRYDNIGFNSYSQDCDNIEKLGKVFPIVFFIIAILISLTTMTRMVEEERVQIGTLKALGYNKFQIMLKYIIYSLLASIVGGVLGAIFGLKFFPYVIITMYQMMYDISELSITFNLYYTILGVGLISLCIVGATVYTASKELKSTPAEMMRPKAPKPGKRVLLEHIPFVWNRLSFTQKVTIRNMFRYKKKFLMTVIGICGCTALIVAGFGLKDSISGIMDFQYIDIYNYDMMLGLSNTLTNDEIDNLAKDLEKNDKIEKSVKSYIFAVDSSHNNFKEETQVMVINNDELLSEIIRLKDLKTAEKLTLTDDGVIITDKLAQLLSVKVGDTIKITDSDDKEFEIKVLGITEHYISHYIYMTDSYYQKLYNKDVETNILFTRYVEKLNEQEEDDLSTELLKNSKIASIVLTSYLITIMDETLSAMNFVVYVLIISAGLLAFIVLYNLSNVNISERIRELATIKVLGFYDKEVYDYVTREIILLTVIGIIFGLLFGYILNSFILGTCEIGILRFKRNIFIQSYIYAIVITVVFTAIINFMTYFSLKKIDMIESLKSVE